MPFFEFDTIKKCVQPGGQFTGGRIGGLVHHLEGASIRIDFLWVHWAQRVHLRVVAGGRKIRKGYFLSDIENRTEFFNRVSCYVGIGINTHEKYRFVIVMILATQVANHEPFQSYKNIEEPKTPTATLNRNGSASRLSSKQSSKQYSERKMSRQF